MYLIASNLFTSYFTSFSISGLKFETVRKMYNDESKQYQRDTLGALCKALDCKIEDLLEIVEE